MQSGIYIPGNGKAAVKFLNIFGKYNVAVSQNEAALKVFELKSSPAILRLLPDDDYAIIHLKNGALRQEEFYYGCSFLSQSSRFIAIGNDVKNIEIVNAKRERRVIDPSAMHDNSK